MLADQAIRLGDANFILAGGQENMTLAPHLLPGSRAGYKFGNIEMKDHMQFDGLWDPYSNVPMGNCAEECAKKYSFSREAQDEFAIESYTRARNATESKIFAREIVPVEIPGKKGVTIVAMDEEPFSAAPPKMLTWSCLRSSSLMAAMVTTENASFIS